ncbi:hypothetical protein [Bosea sp. Root483D1]|uniref:hypothetical protein n=1 Tax=Bosea sp. Root483D1 TaxID=1736544 RepID=UPI000ADF3504|nr:hypothetical protein [Bosea sp. Root483D1]
MDEARIEHIARALCRAARIDPDALIEGGDDVLYLHSATPGVNGKPAWYRFLPAAKSYCQARDFLSIDSLPAAKA